jgi:hypothetical protein
VGHGAVAYLLHADDSYRPVDYKLLVLGKVCCPHFQEQVVRAVIGLVAHNHVLGVDDAIYLDADWLAAPIVGLRGCKYTLVADLQSVNPDRPP